MTNGYTLAKYMKYIYLYKHTHTHDQGEAKARKRNKEHVRWRRKKNGSKFVVYL